MTRIYTNDRALDYKEVNVPRNKMTRILFLIIHLSPYEAVIYKFNAE